MVKKREKNNIVLKIVKKVLYNIIILLSVLLITFIAVQKITDNDGNVAGFMIFKVISGSMQPKYDVGEVVICKKAGEDEVKVGDSIVYRGSKGEFDGLIIMHEVVEIKTDENGKKLYISKGIANTIKDPEITINQIFGIVKCKSSFLTLLDKLTQNATSYFIIVIVLIINIFINFMPKKIYKRTIKGYRKDQGKKKYFGKIKRKNVIKM